MKKKKNNIFFFYFRYVINVECRYSRRVVRFDVDVFSMPYNFPSSYKTHFHIPFGAVFVEGKKSRNSIQILTSHFLSLLSFWKSNCRMTPHVCLLVGLKIKSSSKKEFPIYERTGQFNFFTLWRLTQAVEFLLDDNPSNAKTLFPRWHFSCFYDIRPFFGHHTVLVLW